MNMENCNICKELQLNSFAYMAKLLKGTGVLNAHLGVTENLAIIPSIGPIVYGHSLIVTRSHSNNVLVNALRGNYLQELASCLSELSSTFLNSDDAVFLLAEHGMTIEGCHANLCSTTHGHVHAIPLKRKEADLVVKKAKGRTNELSIEEICHKLNSKKEYCIIAIYEKGAFIPAIALFDSDQLQSQMVRRLVGEVINNQQWDWHLYPQSQMILKMIVNHFSKNRQIGKLSFARI